MPEVSLPIWGSVIAIAASSSPASRGGMCCRFWASVPYRRIEMVPRVSVTERSVSAGWPTAERFGEQRAGEPGLPDQLEVRPGHLAQEAPPLRAGLVLCLDLLDAPMGRGRLRQDLALGERPRLLHQLELGRRVEEGLPGGDGPAARHGQVVERDGAEALGVDRHGGLLQRVGEPSRGDTV